MSRFDIRETTEIGDSKSAFANVEFPLPGASEAIERSGGAAVAVDGKMVDRPVILKAERILHSGRQGSGRRRG